jgi:hypothetical protein
MSLNDTNHAIGAVTKALKEHLQNHPGVSVVEVTVGRTDSSSSGTNPRLNLFLYDLMFDPSLRNFPLDEGQPPPLWVKLRYLLTAYDESGETDSVNAHNYIGEGLRALQELSYIPLSGLDASILKALNNNPEQLKITFDDSNLDLILKLMQGYEEKYRFSISFQVSPVLIATAEPASYSLLVGVDYTQTPNEKIGEAGISIPVIPSLGPVLTKVIPSKFEVNDDITVFGEDLNLFGMELSLGNVDLSISEKKVDILSCKINGSIGAGNLISAGSQILTASIPVANGKRIKSNLIVGDLLPTLTSAVPRSLALNTDSMIYGNIDLSGILLGTPDDEIYLALYQNGKTVKVLDEFTVTPSPPAPAASDPQTQIRFIIKSDNGVLPGDYLLLLRVNGVQAKNSPKITLTA